MFGKKVDNVWSMVFVVALVTGVYAIVVFAIATFDRANDASPSINAELKPATDRLAVAEVPAARRPTKPTTPTMMTLDSGAFTHTSHWERVEGLYDGRYHGSSLRSFFGGALARVAFTGQGIRLYGIVGRGGGIGAVSIDGRPASNANFFAASKATHRLVFESAPLARDRHVLVIEVALSDAPREHRRFVNLESVEIVR